MNLLSCLHRRASAANHENGFALIFVMLVTTLVMIGTATMLTVTVGNIVPAKHSQDTYAAQAAAQAGVQDFVGYLNGQCTNPSISACAWLTMENNMSVTNGTLSSSAPMADTAKAKTFQPQVTGQTGTEKWTVHPLAGTKYLQTDGTIRVVSTGTSGSATRTVTADISGVPNVLRYSYFSNYETVGKAFLDSYYPSRTITVSGDAAKAAGLSSGSTVTWNGTGTAPSDSYTDDVCNALYYADNSNPTSVAQGRAAARLARSNLPVGTDFAEDGYTRTPTQQLQSLLTSGAKTSVTRFAPCEVTFSKGMAFDGPVYSQDALYVSNGEWGSTSGPSFTVPTTEPLPAASTAWSATSSPTFSSSTTPYRTMDQLGGTPITTGSPSAQLVSTSAFALSLPTGVTDATSVATCTYTGPTRVVLSGTTATVTSPQTPAGSSPCYTAAGGSTPGVLTSVPVTSTVIKVNAGAGTTVPRFPGLNLGAGGDVTTYSPSAGDIYVQGSLSSGALSLVAANDIIVTGDVTTTTKRSTNAFGEYSYQSGGAVDLVATNNVRVYHPVACATGSPSNGYCPNDITGLYNTAGAGTVINDGSIKGTVPGSLKAVHPSLQYCNLVGTTADCSTDTTSSKTSREIDAAVFALNGSFLTDNYNRGLGLGGLTVNGGVYQSHRGPAGQLWEIPTAASTRHNSGYKLQINYLSYQTAVLPYVPVLIDHSGPTGTWKVISISTGGSS